MVGAKAGSSGWAFYREWKVPGEGGCAGCRGMVEDDLMLGMYYEQPEQASGGGGKAGKEAAAGAAGAAAEADAMAWELQALRLFRYRLQGSSSSGGDSNSGSGMGSGSGSASVQSRASPLQADQQPPALTPGQTLERLLQTDPAALRARHDELQSNMLIQAATPRTRAATPSTQPATPRTTGCSPMHRSLRPHAIQAATSRVQAAGHGMFLRLSDRVLVKQLDSSAGRNERQAYAAVKADEEQLLEPFTSHCYHAIERDALTLLYVEDLTAAYLQPCIMDIKLGTRIS